jgi:hypothetical protein
MNFHSVAVVLTLVQTKRIRMNIHKKTIQKHVTNLKIKIPSKNKRENPTNKPILHSVC